MSEPTPHEPIEAWKVSATRLFDLVAEIDDSLLKNGSDFAALNEIAGLAQKRWEIMARTDNGVVVPRCPLAQKESER